jgi:hypothetical protein
MAARAAQASDMNHIPFLSSMLLVQTGAVGDASFSPTSPGRWLDGAAEYLSAKKVHWRTAHRTVDLSSSRCLVVKIVVSDRAICKTQDR